VCGYILHDQGRKTRDRVDWVMTQHLGGTAPEDAWSSMRNTWRDRTALKIMAGVPTTGRDNKTPVLHYTLAWHENDKPSPAHMQKVALESLKVLDLSEHQAVIAAHNDKGHLHVHVVVNTVHPETGKTAQLKYSKEKFSKWAEAYEREHGIHCQERIKNNERRREAKKSRARNPNDILMASSGIDLPSRKPYVPVKHKAVSRKQWFEKKDITDRMKTMRASLDAELKSERDATWARHTRERNTLDAKSQTIIDAGRKQIEDRYRPRWRDLYLHQKKEAKHVERIAGNILERAVYVFQNRTRLGGGKPLTMRQMLPLIQSPKKLQARVAQMHERDRRELAREAKFETKTMSDGAMQRHLVEFSAMRDRQSGERQSKRDVQTVRRQGVSFTMAKAALTKEHEQARPLSEPRPFKRPSEQRPVRDRFQDATAPPPPQAPQREFKQAANGNARSELSRAEQIRRDMAEWRKHNQGRDFGREL